MFSYELYGHAGEVPFKLWRDRGIKVPIFDIDGTLAEQDGNTINQEVLDGLLDQGFADIFPEIALASNNTDRGHVDNFSSQLGLALGVKSHSFSVGHEQPRKPSPYMGQYIADSFSVENYELGMVGDRRFTDVQFAKNFGAGAVALCRKIGDGDAPGVSLLRPLESVIVFAEQVFRIAEASPSSTY